MSYPEAAKRRQAKFLVPLMLGTLLVLVSGCGMAPTHYKREGADVRNVKKIAVLPLESFASGKLAGERIRMAVIAELLSRGVDVTEPGEVIRVLNMLKVRHLRSLSVEEIRKIGETLGVDGVMTGSVGSFEVRKGITFPYAEVSINLMLYEASSGDIIWSAWHTSSGPSFWTRHFGAEGKTLNEAAREVVKESIDVLF